MDTSNDDGWYSAEQATFGDRIAGARDAGAFTQEGLAEKLGVRVSTIRDWEDDVSEPRANKLQMVAGVLNVSVSWLLTGEGVGVSEPDGMEPTVSLADITALKADMLTALRRLETLERKLAGTVS